MVVNQLELEEATDDTNTITWYSSKSKIYKNLFLLSLTSTILNFNYEKVHNVIDPNEISGIELFFRYNGWWLIMIIFVFVFVPLIFLSEKVIYKLQIKNSILLSTFLIISCKLACNFSNVGFICNLKFFNLIIETFN